MIEVRLAENPEDLKAALRLRWTVFVEEQGVRPSEERDGRDQDAVHAIAHLDGVLCGAARFIFVGPGKAKIQRMAVIDDVRKHGVGRELLKFLETEAIRRGAKKLTLDAQVHARGFYEKAGYRPHGEQFMDAGIPHLAMEKTA